MHLEYDGNVGIGTVSPDYQLTVYDGTSSAIGIKSGTSGQSALNLGDTGNIDVGQILYDHTSNYLSVTVNASEAMRINSSGNVGIGTSAPLTELVTVGTSMATSQAFVGSVSDTSYSGGIINLSNSTRSIGITSDPTNSGAGTILNFSVDGSEAMRIDSSGNVGIGESSPAAKLHVRNDQGGATGRVLIDANVSSGYETRIEPTDTGFEFTSKSDIRPFIFNLGATPAAKFQMEFDGDFHADGDVIAYSTTVSDKRLKEDIQNIEGAIEKVNSINGVTFVRKHNGERSAGVIAQELLEVLPEAVKEKELSLQSPDGKKYYVVEYDAVTGLLVEAIKEMNTKIKQLEETIINRG